LTENLTSDPSGFQGYRLKSFLQSLHPLHQISGPLIRNPIPELEAINSAATTAIHDIPSPTFKPTKICGKAEGRYTLINICPLFNRYSFATSIYPRGVLVMPLKVFTIIGKKAPKIMITTFERSPIPHQRIIIGIHAIMGICLIVFNDNVKMLLIVNDIPINVPKVIPSRAAKKYPFNTLATLTLTSSISCHYSTA
jgi:hypothetical protein